MLLSFVFERFVERTPFAVMARSLLERVWILSVSSKSEIS
jgi:hypothetical protein